MTTEAAWYPTACILCECNCGIEVQLDGRSFSKIRGDKRHPASAGYTCNKALRLDHYQNADRLTTPLRRRSDGTFEAIDWDIAIAEISERLTAIQQEHGGETIFYYGGGGQGNHLGGAYSTATMAAYGARYRSSALAQEKTGEFWVNARMLGAPHRADFEHCEVALFIGKNPYQSHGFPRARTVLKQIAKDPARTLIVIDPVRTDTADLADFHLQVRPGTDLWLLSALAAVLVQEELVDTDWIDEHLEGYGAVEPVLRRIPVAEYCRIADVSEDLVRQVARRIAQAESVAVYEDLGIQMNRNSTVVSYVEKLVWLLTGNFGKPGTAYVPSNLSAIGRDRGSPAGEGPRSPVVGAPIISGLVPCNVIADEILTDHAARYRAMIIESSNPAHSLAGSARMVEAIDALDLCVVIDVAMTETARHADYVLPAPTQFEKFECTFFTFDFPRNIFHLRHPVLPAPSGLLTEPEIHARLVEAAGALSEDDYAPLRSAAAQGREAFAQAFLPLMADPVMRRLAPVLLYRTLGPTLPDGAASAAVLWAAAHQMAMANADGVRTAGYGEGLAAGERLFDAILSGAHGIVTTDDDYSASWQRSAAPTHQRRPSGIARCRGRAGRTTGAPAGPRLPVRALRRRAPGVHREHDHARPGVAQARRLRRSAHEHRRRAGPGDRQRRLSTCDDTSRNDRGPRAGHRCDAGRSHLPAQRVRADLPWHPYRGRAQRPDPRAGPRRVGRDAVAQACAGPGGGGGGRRGRDRAMNPAQGPRLIQPQRG